MLDSKISKLVTTQIIFLIQLLVNNGAVATDMAESREFMNGKILRIGVIHYPPVINITKLPDGTTRYTGSSFGFLDYIAKGLNITYEYVPMRWSDVKQYGIGPAQVNMVANDEADLAAFGVITSHSKYLAVDLTTPISVEPFHLIVPWPKEENRLLAPIRPFQPAVWLCLGITLVVMSPVLAILSSLYLRYVDALTDHPHGDISRRPMLAFGSLLHNASFLLSHLTNQGFHYDLRLKSRGSFILVGIWCLMCVVLANGYGGVLFSFLSVSKLEQPINSMEELANSKDVQLVLQYRTELTDRFLAATSGPEKVLGDSLRANPDNLITNLGEVKAKLMTGRYAFSYPDFLIYTLVSQTYQENGKKCCMTLAKEPVAVFTPLAFTMKKNGPFTQAISEQIQAMTDAGLLYRNWYDHKPNIDQCKMEYQKASSRHKALSLVDMSSAFVVLGLGISLSILVFLIELVYKRINDHYFTTASTDDRTRPMKTRKEKKKIKPVPIKTQSIPQAGLKEIPEENKETPEEIKILE